MEDSAPIRAARWLLASEARVTRGKKPSIRDAARRFGAAKSAIARHIKALRTSNLPALSHRGVGRPRCLTDAEDAALEAYALWLIQSGSLASRDVIQNGANLLRARRDPPAQPVGKDWWLGWKRDHPWYRSTYSKPVESSRLSAAQQIECLGSFFDKLEKAVEEYDIRSSACWNADEVGIIMAKLAGKFEVLVVKKERNLPVCLFTLYLPLSLDANFDGFP